MFHLSMLVLILLTSPLNNVLILWKKLVAGELIDESI